MDDEPEARDELGEWLEAADAPKSKLAREDCVAACEPTSYGPERVKESLPMDAYNNWIVMRHLR